MIERFLNLFPYVKNLKASRDYYLNRVTAAEDKRANLISRLGNQTRTVNRLRTQLDELSDLRDRYDISQGRVEALGAEVRRITRHQMARGEYIAPEDDKEAVQ